MRVACYSYVGRQFNKQENGREPDSQKTQLVLGFGAKSVLAEEPVYDQLREKFPIADIVLCSTAGEIFDKKVVDGTVSVVAIELEKTIIKTAAVNIGDYESDSYEAGLALANQFNHSDDLCYIMVLSDGGKVNGSQLVNGINHIIQHKVPVTGGLAGDGYEFRSTLTGLNGPPVPGKIIGIAFYGRNLAIAHGSVGGWEMFGPERTVTRASANQLFEINHENALDVYRKYLGPYADELPGSALLFPLSVRLSADSEPVVRTILSIDTVSKSMIFAGDVPEGSNIRFMKANFDKLIDAASQAARQTFTGLILPNPALTLLISCVGRKIILGSRVEEEVEAVHDVLGKHTLITGFYSYGEISPISENAQCELHNQTMTITTFDEL